ncbi:MAG TPA: NUDIX hydrolase N-terminal domain-containing protein [Candidatus Saccharimonadales bacterium]|nr:NUDIX hydrolase N-terminal domain-containing protein [Candidatus Saccharimonadales bacterium]
MDLPPAEQLRYWAHELAGMAKTGLLFATDPYDRDRFTRTLGIAESLAGLVLANELGPARPYLPDVGIVSPKVGCTVAAFDEEGRVALIQRSDNRRWALPGGYAEVGSSPAENGLRELHEETGLVARLDRLVGVYDNRLFKSVLPYHFYICLFRATVTGGAPTRSNESLEVRFFDPADVPEDMSELQRSMLRDAVASPAAAVYQ